MSHQHGWGDGLPECTEIGPTVCLVPETASDGHLRGFWISHDTADSEYRCLGRVIVDPAAGQPCWDMTGTLEAGDLTLSPSVNCVQHSTTGGHGWVREGAWVPA